MKTMQIIPNLGCTINLPVALQGETLHSLPPYAEAEAHDVTTHPASPEAWMRPTGPTTGAYFVGVRKNQGLWLDFNSCWNHTHHVAVVLSIQGINPLTGKPTGKPKMEQFSDGKIPQNYLSTNATPHNRFWLDGFRGENGEVRQYFFSEETLRGIAAQIIGNKRTFSIGIAFFLSKKEKPVENLLRSGFHQTYGMQCKPKSNPQIFHLGDVDLPNLKNPQDQDMGPFVGIQSQSNNPHLSSTRKTYMAPFDAPYGHQIPDMEAYNCPDERYEPKHITQMRELLKKHKEPTEKEPTQLEIAAGARINQQIYKDPESLEFWKKTPASILYVNYAEESQVRSILAAGQIGGEREGALAGLTVGN